ncbi:MAG: succinate dehydrogenase [Alphaproteobacteria bacterium]
MFVAQRLSAMVLAPLVVLHLATIIYAVQDGLSAAEILARTRGSLMWGGLYGLFVLAAAIHSAIGLHTILGETTGWRGAGPGVMVTLFAVAILVLGFRAVGAVT